MRPAVMLFNKLFSAAIAALFLLTAAAYGAESPKAHSGVRGLQTPVWPVVAGSIGRREWQRSY